MTKRKQDVSGFYFAETVFLAPNHNRELEEVKKQYLSEETGPEESVFHQILWKYTNRGSVLMKERGGGKGVKEVR